MPKTHSTPRNHLAGSSYNAAHSPYARNNGKQSVNDSTITPHSNHRFKDSLPRNIERETIAYINHVDARNLKGKDLNDVFFFLVKSSLESIKEIIDLNDTMQHMFNNYFYIELSKVGNTEVLRWFLDGHNPKGDIDIAELYKLALDDGHWLMACICMAYKTNLRNYRIFNCVHVKNYFYNAECFNSIYQQNEIIELIKKVKNKKFDIKDEDFLKISAFAANSRLDFIKKISDLEEFNKDIFDNIFFIELGTLQNFEVLHWFLGGNSCKGEININLLFDAATSSNQWLMMCICIAYGASMDLCPIKKETPLHSLSRASNFEAIKCLTKFEANLNIKNGQGNTPLHIAISEGEGEDSYLITEFLCKNTYDWNIKNNDGNTPLHLAVMKGKTKDVQYFCRNSDNLTIKNKQGSTPLHLAIYEGENSFEIMSTIYHRITNINIKDNDGNTPLNLAASKNNIQAVNLLISKTNTNLEISNSLSCTPLHSAVINDNAEIIRILCKKGADIDAKNTSGATPLHFAVINYNAEIIRTLCKKGADIDAKDTFGSTPLHLAVSLGKLDIITALCEANANLEIKNDIGYTPLHIASYQNKFNVIYELVKYHPNINEKTNDGLTTLHLVVISNFNSYDKCQTIIALCGNGADINEGDNDLSSTPLHFAACLDDINIIEYLIIEGANPDAQNKEGCTPLHMAADSGKLENIDRLIKAEADIEIKDKFGYTPLHIAASKVDTAAIAKICTGHVNTNAKTHRKETPLQLVVKAANKDMNDRCAAIEILYGNGARWI